MSAYYLCTAVPSLRITPGKLVESTSSTVAVLNGLGALLWPSTDAVVAAAAAAALVAHKRGANFDNLQSIMLAGVAKSLQASGGAGWTLNAPATFASHSAMTRAFWQKQPLDSSGGAFTLPLPVTGVLVGDVIDFYDVAAISTATGLGAFAVTLDGASIPVQNPHNMVVAGATPYVLGTPADNGGKALSVVCASNVSFPLFWKVTGS